MQQVQCSHGKKGLEKISQKLATQESLHWFCKQQNFICFHPEIANLFLWGKG